MLKPLTPNERFELMSGLFYRKTGMLAPGKGNTAAGGESDKSRQNRYTIYDTWRWNDGAMTAALERIAELEALIMNGMGKS